MAKEPELKIELVVNGKNISMNEFVHKIVGNLILAILKSIRLDEEPHSAVLNFKIK
jgi:hypothetical protein